MEIALQADVMINNLTWNFVSPGGQYSHPGRFYCLGEDHGDIAQYQHET